jgi:hypothetical protein
LIFVLSIHKLDRVCQPISGQYTFSRKKRK